MPLSIATHANVPCQITGTVRAAHAGPTNEPFEMVARGCRLLGLRTAKTTKPRFQTDFVAIDCGETAPELRGTAKGVSVVRGQNQMICDRSTNPSAKVSPAVIVKECGPLVTSIDAAAHPPPSRSRTPPCAAWLVFESDSALRLSSCTWRWVIVLVTAAAVCVNRPCHRHQERREQQHTTLTLSTK